MTTRWLVLSLVIKFHALYLRYSLSTNKMNVCMRSREKKCIQLSSKCDSFLAFVWIVKVKKNNDWFWELDTRMSMSGWLWFLFRCFKDFSQLVFKSEFLSQISSEWRELWKINSKRSEAFIFHNAGHEDLSGLSYGSFVSHKDSSSPVTQKRSRIRFINSLWPEFVKY